MSDTERERVYFIQDGESGLPFQAINRSDVGSYIDSYLDDLEEDETLEIEIKFKNMTRAELDALPEI
jgi:hypothetical protein